MLRKKYYTECILISDGRSLYECEIVRKGNLYKTITEKMTTSRQEEIWFQLGIHCRDAVLHLLRE